MRPRDGTDGRRERSRRPSALPARLPLRNGRARPGGLRPDGSDGPPAVPVALVSRLGAARLAGDRLTVPEPPWTASLAPAERGRRGEPAAALGRREGSGPGRLGDGEPVAGEAGGTCLL